MTSKNRVKSTVVLMAVIVSAYFAGPFLILPALFKYETPRILSSIWNRGYSPFVNSLSDGNWYKIKVKELAGELCVEYPKTCSPEEG